VDRPITRVAFIPAAGVSNPEDKGAVLMQLFFHEFSQLQAKIYYQNIRLARSVFSCDARIPLNHVALSAIRSVLLYRGADKSLARPD